MKLEPGTVFPAKEAPIGGDTKTVCRQSGAMAMVQAVLPFMRKRRQGHIINITSMGGLVTFPGVGIYNGSKFALEGVSEALGKELKHLGIAVTGAMGLLLLPVRRPTRSSGFTRLRIWTATVAERVRGLAGLVVGNQNIKSGGERAQI